MAMQFVKMPTSILSRADITSTAKLVYVYLADRQGQNAHAWTGIRRIATDCGIGAQAAQKAIKDLESAGLLEVSRPDKSGGRTTSRYVTKDASQAVSVVKTTTLQRDENHHANERDENHCAVEITTERGGNHHAGVMKITTDSDSTRPNIQRGSGPPVKVAMEIQIAVAELAGDKRVSAQQWGKIAELCAAPTDAADFLRAVEWAKGEGRGVPSAIANARRRTWAAADAAAPKPGAKPDNGRAPPPRYKPSVPRGLPDCHECGGKGGRHGKSTITNPITRGLKEVSVWVECSCVSRAGTAAFSR